MKQLWTERWHSHHEHGDGHGLPASGQPSKADPTAEHEVDAAHLPSIQAGRGVGGQIYFDAPSGAGGDMIVAALLDLGVPWNILLEAVGALELRGLRLGVRRGFSGALSGLRFVVEVDEAVQRARTYAEIRTKIEGASLAEGVKRRALAIFERLARAEAKAHHVPVDQVHFHEVGAADSIADVVGASAALDYLGGDVWCSPLPLGRGLLKCHHGVIPLPAPATVECLKGLESYDAGLSFELVTPTAAAVFGALAQGSCGWPRGVVEAVGWGRGTMTLPDRPNLLRAVLVRPAF